MREQFLDQMELEREKGITIKMQPVRMLWHSHRRNTQNETQKYAEKEFLYGDLTYKIRGILFRIREKIGLGHKEQVYHNALEIEFQKAGLNFQSKKNIPITYEGKNIGVYQPDFVLDDKILLELKALPEIGKPQTEQLWSYLKGCDYKLALLVNFGTKDLEIKRVVYDLARLRNSASSLRDQRDSEPYVLNLIDTPGHVDFSYEVSRALAAVEGAILLVDATKGIQAQTLAHLHHAQKEGLTIIPVINKIDSPLAKIEETEKEIARLLQTVHILRISAKEGTGVEALLEEVVAKVPSPKGNKEKPFRALIFDSRFDAFKGIVAFVRVVDGEIRAGEKISFLGTSSHALGKEVGHFVPEESSQLALKTGEIGYIATGVKVSEHVRVGDTIVKSEIRNQKSELALPGFQIPKPVVFVSLYPQDPNEFDALKDALAKLRLSDPSLSYQPESQEALGRGFRCGCLGVLHSEIISERIRREFKIELVISRPSVEFKILLKNGTYLSAKTPAEWPEEHLISQVTEPWILLEVITPRAFFPQTTKFLQNIEGASLVVEDLGGEKFLLKYEIPLREMLSGFYEKLKSISEGMASMDYELLDERLGQLVKLEFRVAGETQEALATITPKQRVYLEGKAIVEKLKALLPPQLFEVALQAVAEGRVIARETIKARRRDVTAPLYGGDVTRKRKLLEIQKKGKKELKEKGKVVIPSKVFLDIFRV